MFRKLDDTISVAGQITPTDVDEAARQGFAMIVNNRPDDEAPDQPAAAAIEAAARAAGLAYIAIPVDPAGMRPDQVAAMADALTASSGPVLAFCRSGTRSTFLWALARTKLGDDGESLIEKAAGAGYDISPLRPALS